jgi:hypothetical protein
LRIGSALSSGSASAHRGPGTPNAVRWDARDERGETVTGQLLLHAGVRKDQIVCWAEIVMGDEYGSRTAGGTPEEQILRQRLDRIADLARRVVERARVNPAAVS